MSKVPRDPAGGLCGSRMRGCYGCLRANSRLFRSYPATSSGTSSQSYQFAMLNRVTKGPGPLVLFAATLIIALRLGLQPVQRNNDTSEKNCVVPRERAWKSLHIIY